MLSVLIPVKDWNPTCLVESLSLLLKNCGKPWEILISDDSIRTHPENLPEILRQTAGVEYFGRQKPLGRSANRNFLASRAKFEYLLFIDGDAGMADENFINKYLDNLAADTVLCGGTLYSPEPPENPDFMLRWKFGSVREQINAAIRQRRPWKSFSTFNFLIPAVVFRAIRFDESIKGYGHEDTVFGIRLREKGTGIIHLDNGLLHLGLEPSGIFLDKSRESAANLCLLYNRNLIPAEDVNDIKLLAFWIKLKRLFVLHLLAIWFRYRRKSLEKKLCGRNPSLLLLDLYKLGSISHIA